MSLIVSISLSVNYFPVKSPPQDEASHNWQEHDALSTSSPFLAIRLRIDRATLHNVHLRTLEVKEHTLISLKKRWSIIRIHSKPGV